MDLKINPKRFETVNDTNTEKSDQETHDLLLFTLWKFMRNAETSQGVPRFVGFLASIYAKKDVTATKMTYLPPIHTAITEYQTPVPISEISQKLAKQHDMRYTHITLDVGAAIKAFHVVWNDKDRSNIIIHLGDFHVFMAFFGSMGKFMTGSGFEEIIYHASLCISGSMNGMLSGKHYNM